MVRDMLCNPFTPKIKGIHRVTYLMLPWFEGNIFDVALIQGTMLPSTYEGFVAASIFIIKCGSFDHGIYLITTVE